MTDKRTQIIAAAADEARERGLAHITRSGISARAGIPSGSFSYFAAAQGEERASLASIKQAVAAAHPDLAVPDIDRYQVNRASRDARILEAAYAEAQEHGWQNITRAAIAHRLGMSCGSISNYKCAPGYAARAMDTLRADVMRLAVEREDARLLTQGLAAGDAVALAAPPELIRAALAPADA